MTRKSVTKRDAEKCLKALQVQMGLSDDEMLRTWAPTLMEDWDWLMSGNPAKWSIVWEEGPYEWALNFPEGGLDEEASIEMGVAVKTRKVEVPAHLFLEPITSWSIGIYLA